MAVMVLVVTIFLTSRPRQASTPSTIRPEFLRDESKTQPNILFILTDDLGYADISLRGAEFDTPNMDQFAQESLSLNKHYVGKQPMRVVPHPSFPLPSPPQ